MYGLDTSLVDDMMKYAIENRDDPENACDKIYKHVINFPSKNEETAFHSVYFGEYKNEVKPALLRDLIKGKVEGEVVLDAGAGMSALALSLLDENPGIKQFISTHNIDYKRVEISDPRMEFVPEETKDGFSIPIEDGVVDTVIVTGRLHHLYPGKESEFLREMVRVLHPQGKILIIEDAWADGLTDPERDEFARRFRGFADEQKQGVSAFLDWVGTRLMPGPELMARPWNFKSAEEWEESLFKPLGLEVKSREYHGFPDKKFTPLPQTTFELVKAGMLASNEKKWNKNRTVENATKKIIPQLIQSLIDMSENISAKDKKRKAAILLDTELADVSARNIKKEIEKLIDLLANVEGNNKHLLYFLENLEIVKGKGRELLSKKGNIKDEDIIVVTRSENMEYFEDQLNKKAIIAAIDRGNFPEDAYMPLLEVTLFAIGKYMGMEKEDLMKYYSKIPNATALQDLDSIDMDELSKGKYTGLFEEDMRSFVIKLIPDAVEFDEGELVDMMGIIRDVLSKA